MKSASDKMNKIMLKFLNLLILGAKLLIQSTTDYTRSLRKVKGVLGETDCLGGVLRRTCVGFDKLYVMLRLVEADVMNQKIIKVAYLDKSI